MSLSVRSPESVLLITLDSCRYDAFTEAAAPNIKALGPLYRAMAPGNFTYASHAAIFMGFTPGVACIQEPFVNPKYAKFFRLAGGGRHSVVPDLFSLEGRSIIDGFAKRGYRTLGTGAVGWFDPSTPTGSVLASDFQEFYFIRKSGALREQLAWLKEKLKTQNDPLFVFLNVGETHVPYYHEGAPWDAALNPCIPFGEHNDAAKCRRRQICCIEYVDRMLEPLLEVFSAGTTIICSDHGDCWGEEGLWEHGISHEMTLAVPLLFRVPEHIGVNNA